LVAWSSKFHIHFADALLSKQSVARKKVVLLAASSLLLATTIKGLKIMPVIKSPSRVLNDAATRDVPIKTEKEDFASHMAQKLMQRQDAATRVVRM
jgi:hypothetical protein